MQSNTIATTHLIAYLLCKAHNILNVIFAVKSGYEIIHQALLQCLSISVTYTCGVFVFALFCYAVCLFLPYSVIGLLLVPGEPSVHSVVFN